MRVQMTQIARRRRPIRRRFTIASATVGAVTTALLTANPTFAQGGGSGGAGAVGAKMEAAAEQLATLGRPFALLGVTLIVLSIIFEPALPEWAKESATRGCSY